MRRVSILILLQNICVCICTRCSGISHRSAPNEQKPVRNWRELTGLERQNTWAIVNVFGKSRKWRRKCRNDRENVLISEILSLFYSPMSFLLLLTDMSQFLRLSCGAPTVGTRIKRTKLSVCIFCHFGAKSDLFDLHYHLFYEQNINLLSIINLFKSNSVALDHKPK